MGLQLLDFAEKRSVLLNQMGGAVRGKEACLVEPILTGIAEPTVAGIDLCLFMSASDTDVRWCNEGTNGIMAQALPGPSLTWVEPD